MPPVPCRGAHADGESDCLRNAVGGASAGAAPSPNSRLLPGSGARGTGCQDAVPDGSPESRGGSRPCGVRGGPPSVACATACWAGRGGGGPREVSSGGGGGAPADRARRMSDPNAAYALGAPPGTTPVPRSAPGVPVMVVAVVTENPFPSSEPDPPLTPRLDAGAVGTDPGPSLLEAPVVKSKLLSLGGNDSDRVASEALCPEFAIVQRDGGIIPGNIEKSFAGARHRTRRENSTADNLPEVPNRPGRGDSGSPSDTNLGRLPREFPR